MNKRATAAACLIAALALSSLATGAWAQEPNEQADPAATSKSVTGVISEGTDADGRPAYFITPEGGEPIQLSYGPSWFFGAASPLGQFVGSTVTVIGQLRDGMPNDNASETAQAQADKAPMLRVRAIVGEELREKGRPPWAGGPKELGETHPGFEGWSQGQAEKEEAKAARAAERAEKAEARAEAKAARAAARAAAKAARAEAKAARQAAKAEGRGNRP